LLRQFLISSFQQLFFSALMKSKDETLSALAEKSLKEVSYHRRHSADWVIRMGQGTEESASRLQNAMDELWMFVDDLFDMDQTDELLLKEGIGVDVRTLRAAWDADVNAVMEQAGMIAPQQFHSVRGSREGKHTEHLGHLLAEMQSLHRAFPGAEW
jgi:ring-1,2-phenylacetyl-CoA epoxidase subunit PaaC